SRGTKSRTIMKQIDRRELLRDSAKIAAGFAALRTAAQALPASAAQGAPGKKASASEKVVLGVVGVRGRGRGLAQNLAALPEAEIAYLCDVDESSFPDSLKGVTNAQKKAPKTVSDFRKILDDPSVDGVVIATPDHWHALISILAMQAGKDVYVEKPVCHNVREGRVMIQAAERYGRVVQAGTQARSGAHFHTAVEYLRSGKLGRVLVAKAINSQRRANIGKKPDSAAPAGVDYNMWLGPAPERAFNPNRFHYNWHWMWDYGTGDMGNDGVHQVDVARWGLGVTAPTAVTCSGGKLFFDDDQETPDTQLVTAEYPGQHLIFEQRIWAPYTENGYENGNVFYCEKGYMLLGADGWKAFGPKNEPGPTSGPSERDRTHLVNFLECVKTRKKPNAPVEDGHYSAMVCHLGNIAYRTGRRLQFDPKSESIIGDKEASAMLTRKYRKPWVVPEKL
ncbi:MAG: Gfo/Idh/MocA family protein, partial [Actinomycetota bacterium]